ncbi:hypothetical protein C1645_826946 [Glomus cerebriforme]|uniref:Uncharacterized protein n=1 Tax=Glomus cerebriforme TaxID=658196 RepID=A0A397SW45_9GLOM|nr:hypothetical protein C1645_826946 [Glomus cerebriforme]
MLTLTDLAISSSTIGVKYQFCYLSIGVDDVIEINELDSDTMKIDESNIFNVPKDIKDIFVRDNIIDDK